MSLLRRTGVLVAVAASIVLLIDVLPVWLLSVTTIYGQAGSTSTYQMIGFALAWFVIAGLAVPLARLPHALVAASVVAVAARLVLQTGIGPNAQVYASSAAVLGVVAWLLVLAVRGVSGRSLVGGVAAGLAASALLRSALGAGDPMWQPAVVGWLVVVVLCGLQVVATLGIAPIPQGERASALAWFAIGPVLILAMLLTAAPLRSSVTALPAGRWPQVVVVLGCVAGALLAARPPAMGRLAPAVSLIALVVLAVVPRTVQHGVHGLVPGWAVVPQALAAVVLGLVLGCLGAPSSSGSTRSGVLAWAGQLVMFVGTLLFFAVESILLPYPPEAVLVVTVVVVAGTALVAPRASLARVRPFPWVPAAVVAVASVVVLLPTLTRPLPPEPVAGRGFPVRLVSYNIHVGGVSQDGKYDERAVADVVRAEHPDVVWLSEVDRGWLVDGDHDALPALARRLGMRYVYAPAAAADWGDAVLSRFPIRVVEQRPLPTADAPTGAEALAVTVDVGAGRRLGLVGTHLQTLDDNATVPVAQSQVVAAVAARLAKQGVPVAVTGDLNAAPGSRALSPLDAALNDGLAPWRPVLTSPADHPTDQLDQLYVTPDLAVSGLSVPVSTASDHRAIAVTLSAR